MEHDINKLIREKVRVVEGQPVSWQKERVWRMIHTERAPQSLRTVYYYAAASIVIILSVIFYVVQLENQKQLAFKIASLESVISDKFKLEEQDRARSGSFKAEVETICPKNIQYYATTQKIRFKQRQRMVDTLPEIIQEVVEVQPEIAEVTIKDDKASERQEEITPEPKAIQAILGFIPKPQEVAVTSKVKKSKFSLFKNHDEGYNTLFQEESRLLTARIN
jgi:hypothetical protein